MSDGRQGERQEHEAHETVWFKARHCGSHLQAELSLQAITRCCSLPSLAAFSFANCLLYALLLGEEPGSGAATSCIGLGSCLQVTVRDAAVRLSAEFGSHQAGIEGGGTDVFCAGGKARQPCFGLVQSQRVRMGPNPSPFLSSCFLARGMQWGPLILHWIPGCCGMLACSAGAGAVCVQGGSGPFPMQGRGEMACVNSTPQDIKCAAVGWKLALGAPFFWCRAAPCFFSPLGGWMG